MEDAIHQRLPERGLLGILPRTAHLIGWPQHCGHPVRGVWEAVYITSNSTRISRGRKENGTPAWLFDWWSELGLTAAKALLIYLIALLGLRVAHRRTLAQ